MTRNLLLSLFIALTTLAAPAQAKVLNVYTLIAPGDAVMARAITDDAACPSARVDGKSMAMMERSAPKSFPPRASATQAAESRTSNFPVRVCELRLPRGTHGLAIAGRALPLPRAVIRRIVVIGDTGCRLKVKDSAFQACNEPAAWPFARIAALAASFHPDLVLHVGDYLYREDGCPEGDKGCAGAVWGYGWQGWNADFFTPAAPLLKAAPWVAVRGNHEECMRAGQGWWQLLDPHPLVAGADCGDPAKDFAGNHTDPYGVELGGKARLIVADFSAIAGKHLAGPELERYRGDAETIRALAGEGKRSGETVFVTEHQPFGAVLTGGKKGLVTGTTPIGDAFASPAAVPVPADAQVPVLPDVTAVLSGHVHLLQYVARENYPVQIVNGFSGTQEDDPTAPATLAELQALPGGESYRDIVTRFGRFGFGLLDRMAGGRWRYTAIDTHGHAMLTRIFSTAR